MTKKIILLHGKARSGKDCFYDTVIKAGYDVEKIMFAEPMKKMAQTFFNISPEELEKTKDQMHEFGCTPRKYLQQLGDLGKELCGPDVWTKIAINKINESEKNIIIITDCRFIQELELIKANFDCTSIKVIREGQDRIETNGHASEAGLSNNLFDLLIKHNSNWPEYKNIVLDIMKNLKK